jgi:putative tricarboxylic transport membrane protein
MTRDGWGGLAVLAASLLLFGLTLGLKDSPLVPIGPGFYPRIVLGLTALLSLWLLITDFYFKKQAKEEDKEKLNYRLVALTFAAFGLYCALLPLLGFRIATALYVAASSWLLEPPLAGKGWMRVLLLALSTAFLTHLVFERYLLVLLPRGSWTGF